MDQLMLAIIRQGEIEKLTNDYLGLLHFPPLLKVFSILMKDCFSFCLVAPHNVHPRPSKFTLLLCTSITFLWKCNWFQWRVPLFEISLWNYFCLAGNKWVSMKSASLMLTLATELLNQWLPLLWWRYMCSHFYCAIPSVYTLRFTLMSLLSKCLITTVVFMHVVLLYKWLTS